MNPSLAQKTYKDKNVLWVQIIIIASSVAKVNNMLEDITPPATSLHTNGSLITHNYYVLFISLVDNSWLDFLFIERSASPKVTRKWR